MTTAVDLYSGVGGWSFGLKMAGIDVVSSYEWWNKANDKEYFSRPRKDIGYTFDVSETRTVSRSEFEKMLKCYSFKPDELTYKCIPGRCKGLVKIWKESA